MSVRPEEQAESIGVDVPIEIAARPHAAAAPRAQRRTTSRRLGCSCCAQEILGPMRSTTRSARTSRAGRTSIPRRRISSARWRMCAGTGSTGSGASLVRKRPLRPGDRHCRDPAVAATPTTWSWATRIARAACCRFARGSRSATGPREDFNYPAEVWSTNTTRYIRRYTFVGKHVTRIELDPDHRLMDIDRSNNVWTAPPAS